MPPRRRRRVEREEDSNDQWNHKKRELINFLNEQRIRNPETARALFTDLMSDMPEELLSQNERTIRSWMSEGRIILQPYLNSLQNQASEVAHSARDEFMRWIRRGYNYFEGPMNDMYAEYRMRALNMARELFALRQQYNRPVNRENCFNRESPFSLDTLQRPYVQLQSGHCYDNNDWEYMINRRRNILTNTELTPREVQCLQTVRDTGNVGEACQQTLKLNPPLPAE